MLSSTLSPLKFDFLFIIKIDVSIVVTVHYFWKFQFLRSSGNFTVSMWTGQLKFGYFFMCENVLFLSIIGRIVSTFQLMESLFRSSGSLFSIFISVIISNMDNNK